MGSLHKDMKKTDRRQKLWEKQRKERGFDDTETWNLFHSIAEYVLPRLIVFKAQTITRPIDVPETDWSKKLGKMITAFELLAKDDYLGDEVKFKKIRKGLKLFHKYYFNLWW